MISYVAQPRLNMTMPVLWYRRGIDTGAFMAEWR